MFAAYLFEAKQIQTYIFATSKLRDAAGASELINALGHEGLSPPNTVAGLAHDILARMGILANVYRSTGGVLDLTVAGNNALAKLHVFRAAFRLAVAQLAPGLAYADGIAPDADENACRKAARVNSGSQGPRRGVAYPLISPMIRPAPRSGGVPADVVGWTKGGQCIITEEFADLPTLAKRNKVKPKAPGASAVGLQFAPDKKWLWPDVFEKDEDDSGKTRNNVEFPFPEDGPKRIAMLHADANDMGQLFEEAAKADDSSKPLTPTKIREMSVAIAKATGDAVRAAMAAHVLPKAIDKVVPARPIILGGDDISIILRADLALDFAQTFVREFQVTSAAVLERFFEGQNKALTMKVGIVILGIKRPFGAAYHLCEVLAKGAKVDGESRFGIWRLTTSAIPQSLSELTEDTTLPGGTIRLWEKALTDAQLCDLKRLAALLAHDDVGRGAMRRVPDLMRTDSEMAKSVYRRALEVVKKRNSGVHGKLKTALDAFGAWDTGIGSDGYCPLLQAHDLGMIDPTATDVEDAA